MFGHLWADSKRVGVLTGAAILDLQVADFNLNRQIHYDADFPNVSISCFDIPICNMLSQLCNSLGFANVAPVPVIPLNVHAGPSGLSAMIRNHEDAVQQQFQAQLQRTAADPRLSAFFSFQAEYAVFQSQISSVWSGVLEKLAKITAIAAEARRRLETKNEIARNEASNDGGDNDDHSINDNSVDDDSHGHINSTAAASSSTSFMRRALESQVNIIRTEDLDSDGEEVDVSRGETFLLESVEPLPPISSSMTGTRPGHILPQGSLRSVRTPSRRPNKPNRSSRSTPITRFRTMLHNLGHFKNSDELVEALPFGLRMSPSFTAVEQHLLRYLVSTRYPLSLILQSLIPLNNNVDVAEAYAVFRESPHQECEIHVGHVAHKVYCFPVRRNQLQDPRPSAPNVCAHCNVAYYSNTICDTLLCCKRK